MIAYKFLAAGSVSPFTGFRWPARGDGPGPWVESGSQRPDLGVHACLAPDLAYWLDAELWRVELEEPVAEGQRQVVAHRGRLLSRIEQWDAAAALRFAERAALMARDRVAAALRREGLEADAADLGRARGLGALLAASTSVTAPASALAAYLAESAETALAGDHAVSAYISARAAVPSAGGDEREFAAERARQGLRLAEQLGLEARARTGP